MPLYYTLLNWIHIFVYSHVPPPGQSMLNILRNSSSVDQFLLAFCQFTNHWRLPATLWLDNVKIFKSWSREIPRILRSPQVYGYLSDNQVEWKFIIRRSSPVVERFLGEDGEISEKMFMEICCENQPDFRWVQYPTYWNWDNNQCQTNHMCMMIPKAVAISYALLICCVEKELLIHQTVFIMKLSVPRRL